MNYLSNNRNFWNQWSKDGGPWSRRCSKDLIQKARNGDVNIFVTTQKFVPETWLPKEWDQLNVLGLAAGGGQQIPIIAATGATVTSFDISEEQLQRDIEVCQEESLQIKTVQGDMHDLSCFKDQSFDLIVNPVSNCYAKDIQKVWQEIYRVLAPGGSIISGHNNPVAYALDYNAYKKGQIILKNAIPYSDIDSLQNKELELRQTSQEPFEFGHSLAQLIGGQIKVGLKINGFYEDYWGDKFDQPIDKIMPQFFATLAQK